jgi:hypothetical protein
MYLDEHIFVPNRGVDHKAGALAKPVNELYVTMLSQVPSLSCVGDALQKLLRALDRYCGPLNLLVLAVDNNDWRLPNLQSEPVGSIGVEKMKQSVHRIHAVESCHIKDLPQADRASGLRSLQGPAQAKSLTLYP